MVSAIFTDKKIFNSAFFPRTSGWHYAELGFRNTSIWLCIFLEILWTGSVMWFLDSWDFNVFICLFVYFWFIALSDSSDIRCQWWSLQGPATATATSTAEIYSMNVSLLAHAALFFDVMNPRAFLPHHPQKATSTVWQEWDPVSCSVPVCVIKYCCVRENDRQFRND